MKRLVLKPMLLALSSLLWIDRITLPNGGSDNTHGQEDGNGKNEEDEVVEVDFGRKVDRSEGRTRYAVEAVFPAGETGPLGADKERQLAQGKSDHDKIDALPANGEDPDNEGSERASEASAEKGDDERDLPFDEKQGERVGPGPEEYRVAERREARVAEKDIIAHREDGKDKHFARHGIVAGEKGKHKKKQRYKDVQRHDSAALCLLSFRSYPPLLRPIQKTFPSRRSREAAREGSPP